MVTAKQIKAIRSSMDKYKISHVQHGLNTMYDIEEVRTKILCIGNPKGYRAGIKSSARVKINKVWYAEGPPLADRIMRGIKGKAPEFTKYLNEVADKMETDAKAAKAKATKEVISKKAVKVLMEAPEIRKFSEDESEEDPIEEPEDDIPIVRSKNNKRKVSKKKPDEEPNEKTSDESNEEPDEDVVPVVHNKTKGRKLVSDEPKYPVIKLRKREKMIGLDHKVFHIEVRGTRKYDNCFFNLQDVARCFKIPNLKKSVTKKDRGYDKDTHYRRFSFLRERGNSTVLTECLYLTYTGLLRVLFVTRNRAADQFVSWACRRLFAVQMGTKQDRQALAADLLGIASEVVSEILSKTSTKIPVCYWFTAGLVKDFREYFNIGPEYDDNDIVCKVGETNSFKRRTREHTEFFNSLDGGNLKLKWFCYIDPLNLKKAEKDLLAALRNIGMIFDSPDYKELLIHKPGTKDVNKVKREFNKVAKLYAGHLTEANQKVESLEVEIAMLNLKNKTDVAELTNHYVELLREKDAIIAAKTKKISKKNKEISALKLENANLKLEKADLKLEKVTADAKVERMQREMDDLKRKLKSSQKAGSKSKSHR